MALLPTNKIDEECTAICQYVRDKNIFMDLALFFSNFSRWPPMCITVPILINTLCILN